MNKNTNTNANRMTNQMTMNIVLLLVKRKGVVAVIALIIFTILLFVKGEIDVVVLLT